MAWGLRVAALAAALLLAGCNNDPEPFPFAITSVAVLPAEVIPSNYQAGYLVGNQLTRVLRDHTLFRVVGIDSTSRILAQPDGIQLYHRFRSLVSTSRNIEGPVARAMGERMGAGAVLYPRLAMSLTGPVSGEMALTVLAYEVVEGQRVWQGYARRSFAGHPGEPAFNRTLGELTDDVIAHMPRPAGELDQ
jgi:hypothetical protein